MICPRCLLRRGAASTTSPPSIIPLPIRRHLTTTPSPAASTSPTTNTPSQPTQTTPPKAKPASTAKPLSSVPAGRPLRGLNYFKNKQDPVALPDEDYPPWLWTVLGEAGRTRKPGDQGAGKGVAAKGEMDLDAMLYSKSQAARRLASKTLRKQAAARPRDGTPPVPLYEQSVDLPAEGPEAVEARGELAKAMRAKRRADIKEGNFLKGMR